MKELIEKLKKYTKVKETCMIAFYVIDQLQTISMIKRKLRIVNHDIVCNNNNDQQALEILQKTALELKGKLDNYTETLRIKLCNWQEANETYLAYKDFTKLLYEARLVLARLAPINEKDPITMEEIATKNRLVVSTGHQFDVIPLAKHICSKVAFINPLTNLNFSRWDMETIKRFVDEREKNRNWLFEHEKIRVPWALLILPSEPKMEKNNPHRFFYADKENVKQEEKDSHSSSDESYNI